MTAGRYINEAMSQTARRTSHLAQLAVAIVMLLPSLASAQVITGQVVDSSTGVAVGTGFVVLLDQTGVEVARALSSSDGRFTITVPREGQYVLRSERIGYRAIESDPIVVSGPDPIAFTLEVAALPVRLATVTITGRDRCRSNPEESEETVLVWEEIRKALTATTWSDEQELFYYRNYSFQRQLNAGRDQVVEETGVLKSAVSDPPYGSIPAEALARDGYIVDRSDGTWYYVPDAYVLLDPSFLGTHCFHVVRGSEAQEGLIGLAFEPMRSRRLPDVKGTLWLDEATSELRTLEVQHTRVPQLREDKRVGGTVHFLMLPSGAWIVREWTIRTPMIVLEEGSRPINRPRATIDGFMDTGGEIIEVSTRTGEKLFQTPLARVSGTVYDSTTGFMLEGALVSVVGADFRTVVDRFGQFHLEVPLSGWYLFSVTHPRLDSIGVPPQREFLQLERGSTATVEFAMPHVDGVLRRLCGRSTRSRQRRVAIGEVRSPDATGGVRGARVRAEWQSIVEVGGRFEVKNIWEEVRTDESGFFAICDIPVGRLVTIEATKDGHVSREASLIFPQQEGGDLLMAWDRLPGQAFDQKYLAADRVWRVDLMLGAPRGDEPVGTGLTLSGIVTDRDNGQPLSDAAVILNDSDSTRTRDDGTFGIEGVSWLTGSNRIEFRRSGYATIEWNLWMDEDEADVSISATLMQLPFELEEIEVAGTRMAVPAKLVEFYRRMEQGRGSFVRPEDLERMGGGTVLDALRRISGITILRPGANVVGVNEYIQFSGASAMCRSLMQQPLIYVDGVLFDIDFLLSLQLNDVAAIETYNGASEMPPEYNRTGSDCGLIVLWTK